MDRRTLIVSGLVTLGTGWPAPQAQPRPRPARRRRPARSRSGQSEPVRGSTGPPRPIRRDEMVNNVSDFMGVTAEAAGGAVERVFQDNGRPTAYIAGEEGLGRPRHRRALWPRPALHEEPRSRSRSSGRARRWAGTSAATPARVFTLCYNLQYPEVIFQRFPGVEGSAYLIGGLGVNYLRPDDVTLAPIRAGVGLRLGANVGYLGFSRSSGPCRSRTGGEPVRRPLQPSLSRGGEELPSPPRGDG